MSESIGIDELMAELSRLEGGDPNGQTTEEIAEKINRSKYFVLKRLKPLIRAGKIKFSYGIREDITGREQRVPVYSVVVPQEEDSEGRSQRPAPPTVQSLGT